ncbi:BON domain-containing protein [Maribacter sp. ACAM166]|nr:BON domain-containing protein [Maribacter sp. ACAM166]
MVTLTSFVDEFPKKVAAEKAAKSIAGVKAVAEDIIVKYGDNYKTTDKEIAKAAVRALELNTSVPREKLMVKVDDGYIFLSGELKWDYQKNAAKNTIQNLQGVKGVINNITIYKETPPTEVAHKIMEAFKRSADIDANTITVKIEGHTAILTGTVNSLKEKDDATRAAF